jgi:hypothetical protein
MNFTNLNNVEAYSNIIFLDIIHRPVFYLKHVSANGFCLWLHVKPIQLGPIDRDGDYLKHNVSGTE